jgi:hypothetical protein
LVSCCIFAGLSIWLRCIFYSTGGLRKNSLKTPNPISKRHETYYVGTARDRSVYLMGPTDRPKVLSPSLSLLQLIFLFITVLVRFVPVAIHEMPLSSLSRRWRYV